MILIGEIAESLQAFQEQGGIRRLVDYLLVTPLDVDIIGPADFSRAGVLFLNVE